MTLLDTDVLIDVQRKFQPALDWFSGLTELPAVPGFVVMELIQDARDSSEVVKARRLVAPFQVVWPTEAECRSAMISFETLHLSSGLGLIDALIGAMAVGRDAELCTFNTKHYRAIPGIKLLKPYVK